MPTKVCPGGQLKHSLFWYPLLLGYGDDLLPFHPHALLPDQLPDAPPIPKRIEIAQPVNTLMLDAWHLSSFEASQMYPYIYECLYFKTITVDCYTIKAMPPESVVAIAQIAETRPEKEVDEQH